MLHSLTIHDVGPLVRAEIALRPRLNVVTGDNGLGKSFLLELAWWVLTRTWASAPAWPRPEQQAHAHVHWRGSTTTHPVNPLVPSKSGSPARFDQPSQSWRERVGNDIHDAPTLFALADGSFAAWDPVRHVRWVEDHDTGGFEPESVGVTRFTPDELVHGLEHQGRAVSNGLIRDWVSWQRERPDESGRFAVLEAVLAALSEDPANPLRPGRPMRVFVDDAREFPTLEFAYGTTPLIHTSSAVRRIVGLAYLLVWAWHEHLGAAKLRGQAPASEIVLLLDEVENHLPPRWQRRILPALLAAIAALPGSPRVQLIATTHAPLTLAGLEPVFDPASDAIFHLAEAQTDRGVEAVLSELPWSPQGDAVNWLVSESFGLRQARSLDAERAIEAAEAFMRGEPWPAPLDTREAIHDALRRSLPDHDHFWPRWLVRIGVVA